MKNKDIFNKKGIVMLEGKIICLPNHPTQNSALPLNRVEKATRRVKPAPTQPFGLPYDLK